MSETYISKMSVKGLGCNPRQAAAQKEGEEKPVKLCLIYGKASGLKHGEDKSGSIWTALSGDFKGVNLENNQEFRSGKLFLPGGIQDTIEAPLLVAENDGGKSVVIEFALEIRAVKASNPIGYSYQAVSLIAPVEANDMATLEKQFGYKPPVKQIESSAPGTEQQNPAQGPAVHPTHQNPAPHTQPAPAPTPQPAPEPATGKGNATGRSARR
jgi:hypothetical protein